VRCAANCIPLLIQQNVDGSADFFNRSWAECKVGFNDSRGNFWLGNDLLAELTQNGRYKLRFDLQGRDGVWYYAEYSTFIVKNETYNYALRVAGYSGNAVYDAFMYHNERMFTTYDRDNDLWSRNCAATYGGAFWYNECARSHINSNTMQWSGGSAGTVLLQSSHMWLKCQ